MKLPLKVALGVFVGCVTAAFVAYYVLDNLHTKEVVAINYAHTLELERIANERDSVQVYADSVDVVLARYKRLTDSLIVVDEGHQSEIDRLNMELETALEDVVVASYDDNYDWLQRRYITTDSLEYPFSGEQVSDIAVDLLEGEYAEYILDKKDDIILVLRDQMTVSDSTIMTLTRNRDDLNALANKLYADLKLKEEEDILKDDQIVKIEKAKRMWRTGALGAGGFIVLLLLIL
jgi:hypothetical protein